MTSLEHFSPNKCKNFSGCNAMICPLDSDWRKRAHLPAEKICIYLREYYKELGDNENIPGFICKALDQCAEDIMKKHSVIRRSVILGSTSPSKISQFKQRRDKS